MMIRKAYKYCLKESQAVLRLFAQTVGCCRLVWNRALALQKFRLDNGLKILTYAEVCKKLAKWKQQEEPGKNIKQKSGLNRSILDQGWYEFRRQLEYKQKWRGGKVVASPPEYTSQECLECHYTCKENQKTQSLFQCIACGYTAHANFVGAHNVLAAGQAASACGSNLIRGRKQEPAKIREESMLLKFA